MHALVMKTTRRRIALLTMITSLLIAGCSGDEPSAAGADPTTGCDGSCASASSFLSVADVQLVIAQGVAEAQGLGAQATIAVVDRVGNVLAVYRMGPAANRSVVIASGFNADGSASVSGGLEGLRLPVTPVPVNLDDQAAIAKAITGAYLSSEGNAFSTRTASQIIQEHFAPNEAFQAGGPLFGVQFSQLACSDLMRSYNGVSPSVGPQRSPLGLSADPGGFPLYKNGTVVGGVGVLADGVYGLDKDITNRDRDIDEMVAYAATFGFAAPVDRRADRITADGRTLRFSDVEFAELTRNPANATPFASLGAAGALVATTGYSNGTIVAGTAFGQPASGIRPDPSGNYAGQDAFVLVDAVDAQRYPPQASAVVGSLTALEVQNLMRELMSYASQTRAQIRRPLGSPARVTASIVDTSGAILAIARSRDAPIFGIDVSLQKARTAVLLSSNSAATFLTALPNAKYAQLTNASATVVRQIVLGDYVTSMRGFVGSGTALADGAIAYSARAAGNLARPFYPDGIDGSPAGPLSKPAGEWSVFSTGLQLDVAQNAILQHVLHTAGLPLPDVAVGCAGVTLANDFTTATQTVSNLRLANGLQIFPGGVPIYRGGVLVGAVGISGDGVDQDDMIAFLGVNQGHGGGNAPLQLRADTLTPQGVRLRYVQCPQAPFLREGIEEGVCQGK